MSYQGYSHEYAKRGSDCYPATIALTSNRKFISPSSFVYKLPYVCPLSVLQYPGYSGDYITNTRNMLYPEDIKAYYHGYKPNPRFWDVTKKNGCKKGCGMIN